MKRWLASNAERVRSAALAALPELVRQWLPNGEGRGEVYVALNPRRNDHHLGSFQINTRTGLWRDFSDEGVGGRDAISLYAYCDACDYRTAYKAVANDPLVRAALAAGPVAPLAKSANPLKLSATKIARARRLYDNAADIAGTPAELYLKSRGLRRTTAWDCLRASVLRYDGRSPYPALLAPFTDSEGSVVGLQRLYLQPSGAKLDVPDPRRMLGQAIGCAIRLGEPIDRLIICEGLEDGLTLFQELDGHAVWAAGGASFLAQMALPESVCLLTIAADNDAPGENAAQRAADAYSVGGREVQIMRPSSGFKDFNDELRGRRS